MLLRRLPLCAVSGTFMVALLVPPLFLIVPLLMMAVVPATLLR